MPRRFKKEKYTLAAFTTEHTLSRSLFQSFFLSFFLSLSLCCSRSLSLSLSLSLSHSLFLSLSPAHNLSFNEAAKLIQQKGSVCDKKIIIPSENGCTSVKSFYWKLIRVSSLLLFRTLIKFLRTGFLLVSEPGMKFRLVDHTARTAAKNCSLGHLNKKAKRTFAKRRFFLLHGLDFPAYLG
jgi:hypothetical protein